MELIDYPEAIAEQARKTLKVDQQMRQLQSEIDSLIHAVSHQVAFDPTLKNQNQRDTRKTELLTVNNQYTAKLAELDALRCERSLLKIELEYLRNKFAALRLAAAVKLDVLVKLSHTAQQSEALRSHLAGMALQSIFSTVYFAQNQSLPSEVADRAVTFADAVVARLNTEITAEDALWAKTVVAEDSAVENPEESEFIE
jgi:hypothetical protein